MHRLNNMFGFLNPHVLLQSESHTGFTNAFKKTYDEPVYFSGLAVEIDRFKKLVQSNETTFVVMQQQCRRYEGGGSGGRAPYFGIPKILFLEHHVASRQQAMM